MPFKKIETEKGKWERKCKSPEHNPPMHIVLKPGLYEYVCPSCGATQMVSVPEITC